mgnify:CR=1 FL=1
MELFAQTLLNGVLMAGVYALVATGLALSLGVVGIVNFAHGEFLMLGAYLSYLLFAFRGVDPLLSLGLAFLAAFLVGALTYHGLIRPVLASVGRISRSAAWSACSSVESDPTSSCALSSARIASREKPLRGRS